MSDAPDPSTDQVPRPDPDDDRAVAELADRLLDAARRGETAHLMAYVDAGAPVDLASDNGDTLLMLAAYHGHTGAVAALLERGADPNRVNAKGQTPVAGAVFKGHEAVVDALVSAGADVDAGHPSARATASMLEREDLLAGLDGR